MVMMMVMMMMMTMMMMMKRFFSLSDFSYDISDICVSGCNSVTALLPHVVCRTVDCTKCYRQYLQCSLLCINGLYTRNKQPMPS